MVVEVVYNLRLLTCKDKPAPITRPMDWATSDVKAQINRNNRNLRTSFG
jgi:hypothetical protein